VVHAGINFVWCELCSAVAPEGSWLMIGCRVNYEVDESDGKPKKYSYSDMLERTNAISQSFLTAFNHRHLFSGFFRGKRPQTERIRKAGDWLQRTTPVKKTPMGKGKCSWLQLEISDRMKRAVVSNISRNKGLGAAVDELGKRMDWFEEVQRRVYTKTKWDKAQAVYEGRRTEKRKVFELERHADHADFVKHCRRKISE